MSQQTTNPLPATPAPTAILQEVPAVLRRAGHNAVFAADEFFAARVRNPHTREAYRRVVTKFLAWCEDQGLEIRHVTPGLAGRYLEQVPGEIRTKNLALSALRHFFDTLVNRHAVLLNPFTTVRGLPTNTEGRTPGISIEQARQLLRSLDTSNVVGLRDRALLGTLTYTGARVGALVRLRLKDFEDHGSQRVLRFLEKGGKYRQIPVRHDLQGWLTEYIEAAGIGADPKQLPLFRAAVRKTKTLSNQGLSTNAVQVLLKRRLRDAGLPTLFSPHSFRVLVVTDLLTQQVPLEDVQYLAGHANPKTTQIYDRRQHQITQNIVERISV